MLCLPCNWSLRVHLHEPLWNRVSILKPTLEEEAMDTSCFGCVYCSLLPIPGVRYAMNALVQPPLRDAEQGCHACYPNRFAQKAPFCSRSPSVVSQVDVGVVADGHVHQPGCINGMFASGGASCESKLMQALKRNKTRARCTHISESHGCCNIANIKISTVCYY
jgi:hypothetical protein